MRQFETGKLVSHRSSRINSGKNDTDKQVPLGMSTRTYVKVHGNWCYLCRAIDRDGNLVAEMLSTKRNMEAAQRFFQQAVEVVGHAPQQVTTDGHSSYPRAICETLGNDVIHQCHHYLNNLIEQDHRGIRTALLPHARVWKRNLGSARVLEPLMRFVSSFGFVPRSGNRFPWPCNVICSANG